MRRSDIGGARASCVESGAVYFPSGMSCVSRAPPDPDTVTAARAGADLHQTFPELAPAAHQQQRSATCSTQRVSQARGTSRDCIIAGGWQQLPHSSTSSSSSTSPTRATTTRTTSSSGTSGAGLAVTRDGLLPPTLRTTNTVCPGEHRGMHNQSE